MNLKKNYIHVQLSILLITVISGCGGYSSKSSDVSKNERHSLANSQAQIRETKMVHLDAFQQGMRATSFTAR